MAHTRKQSSRQSIAGKRSPPDEFLLRIKYNQLWPQMDVTWDQFKLAYRRYCDLNDFHTAIDPVPAFLAFVGIDYGWANNTIHKENGPEGINAKAIDRLRALASDHYVAMYKAMKVLDET